MEVSVDRDAFLKGLQMVHNMVEPRQTLPILANVLLESDGDTLRLTATDLEVGARVSVPAKVATGGSVTLSARKLLEIVKELPAAALDPQGPGEFVGGHALWRRFLQAGGSERRGFSRGGHRIGNGVDHPRRQGASGHAHADHVCRLARREPLRPERCAVRRAGAGDPPRGYRRASSGPGGAARWPRQAGSVSGIVPRKAVQEIARIVGSGEDVEVAISDNQFMSADAERAADGAAHRGDVSQLRAGSAQARTRTRLPCPVARSPRRSGAYPSSPRSAPSR